MTGGHGFFLSVEADGESAVRAAARAELKAGAQVLKFMVTGGVLTQGVRASAEALTEAELRAGVEEAITTSRVRSVRWRRARGPTRWSGRPTRSPMRASTAPRSR